MTPAELLAEAERAYKEVTKAWEAECKRTGRTGGAAFADMVEGWKVLNRARAVELKSRGFCGSILWYYADSPFVCALPADGHVVHEGGVDGQVIWGPTVTSQGGRWEP